MSEETDYQKYRGKCLEMSQALVEADPTLTLVRGHYYCPIWNSNEAHWWCVDAQGKIVDPTRLQFPSGGLGTYTPFNGIVECEQCGKEMAEEDAIVESGYALCSTRCYGRMVGVPCE